MTPSSLIVFSHALTSTRLCEDFQGYKLIVWVFFCVALVMLVDMYLRLRARLVRDGQEGEREREKVGKKDE